MKIETEDPEVFIDINQEYLSYKIIQIISGKNKVRRRVVGRPCKPKRHDQFGNQLYNRFANADDALNHARNYIRDHFKKH